MKIIPQLLGVYATRIYLPCSAFSRKWRSLKSSGRERNHFQRTTLPSASWNKIVKPSLVSLVEIAKANGNVRVSELGVLAQLSRHCPDGTTLFEIGTFDGRTTLNLALNSPPNCRVVTLDLPENAPTKFALAKGERHFTRKPAPGSRYRNYSEREPEAVAKIEQLLGDSASFNPARYRSSCSLVFVNGSHALDTFCPTLISRVNWSLPADLLSGMIMEYGATSQLAWSGSLQCGINH